MYQGKNVSKKEYNKKYYTENKEACRKQQKEYYDKNQEKMVERSRRNRQKPKYKISYYKYNCKARNHSWELSNEQATFLILADCYYCGTPSTEKRTNGIDRLDNDLGYFPANCVSCCSTCNMMKRNASVKDFIGHCRKLVEFWDTNGDSENRNA